MPKILQAVSGEGWWECGTCGSTFQVQALKCSICLFSTGDKVSKPIFW